MNELLQNLIRLQELEFKGSADGDGASAISDLRQKIPSPILQHYDRLTDQGKKGLAPVRHQVCTGCHMSIPLASVITLMHATDIQLCGNCGRYLYLPSEELDALSEASHKANAMAAKRGPKARALAKAT